jgi:hypothetical protein
MLYQLFGESFVFSDGHNGIIEYLPRELPKSQYFLSVVRNPELDPELRIKAAAEVGAFAAYAGAFERQRLRTISGSVPQLP